MTVPAEQQPIMASGGRESPDGLMPPDESSRRSKELAAVLGTLMYGRRIRGLRIGQSIIVVATVARRWGFHALASVATRLNATVIVPTILTSPARRTQSRRDGFTLMEMMLVMAILVAVVAMALPTLRGPMEDQRLLKTADLIRAQWTRGRASAMRTGRIHVFRYQVSTDVYVVEPWYAEGDYLEAAADDNTMPASTGLPLAAPGEDLPNLPLGVSGARLPTGVMFYAGETEMDARSSEVGQQSGMPSAGANSAPPVVFYPDGSTSDAKVVLTNERFFVEVRIRGLTGMVRISDLLVAEELSTQGGFVN